MAGRFNISGTRPNRLTSKKDRDYHSQMGRFCLQTLDSSTYQRYIQKCLINYSFYSGGDGQWVMDEDNVAFFLDESGDLRNRLKFTKNVLKPMVKQYEGNAIRLSFDAKAECISPFVINKREKELKRIQAFETLSKTFPYFKDIIKENIPIGETEMETKEIFDNSFVEDYAKNINNLLEYVSLEIGLNDKIKHNLARSLAIYGLAIYKGSEFNSNYVGTSKHPLFFGWDLSAIESDLSDSEYMFEWYYMDAPSIFEKYPNLTKDERDAIEKFSSNKSNNNIHQFVNNVLVQTAGKIPVYECYWKDTEKKEAGYVLDEFDYPYYTYINTGEENSYTDKDLIEPPTDFAKKKLGDKKKEVVYDGLTRYAIFIPKEEISGVEKDIMLEWGVLPFQEKHLRKPSETYFPYKCETWDYERGEILTPLDDAIDPQRFLNRTISVIESRMSSMRGSGAVISKDAAIDGEEDILRNINSSKPVFVDTSRTGSVQNSIGEYGTNMGGTLQMFQVIDMVQQYVQDTTGVNEAMTGTQGGSDVLVGVVEAQIQRGSLIQEPFYAKLTSILKQAYNHIATCGKAIYIENPRQLSIMVGEDGAKAINLTKEHLLQDYRIFVKRSETKEQAIQGGNQLLFTLLQAGLLDQIRFANLFDRSDSTMIAQSLREYHREKLQAQYEMDKVNAQRVPQMQQAQAEQQQMMIDEADKQRQAQVDDKLLSHELDMEKTEFSENAKTQRDMLKNGVGV